MMFSCLYFFFYITFISKNLTCKKTTYTCVSFRVFVFSNHWLFAWASALALNVYLLVLAPNLYIPALAPNLYLPALAPNLCLLALAPYLYLPTLVYNFITSPYLLNLCLNLRPWSTICITGLRPEFAFTLLLILVEVVVVIVAVVISLEKIIPIFVRRF